VENCFGSLAYHQLTYVRFEVITAVTMTIAIFWDVMPCGLFTITKVSEEPTHSAMNPEQVVARKR
jgi:hypothetical protein